MQNGSKKGLNDEGDKDINIKSIILDIWRERKIIGLITGVIVLGAIIYSFVFIKPQYEATSELIMKEPNVIETRYGEYTFPSSNINDYIQYIYSDAVLDKVIKNNDLKTTRAVFKEKLSVKYSITEGSNRFQVVLKQNNSQRAKDINNALVDQYLESINILYKKNALDKFILEYEVMIDTINNTISEKQAVLSELEKYLETIKPIYTLQKSLFNDPESAALYANNKELNIASLSNHIVSEEFINNDFLIVQTQVTNLETDLISLKESLAVKTKLYKELLVEETRYEENIGTENEKEILNGRLDVFAQIITVTNQALEPENALPRKRLFNVAIGFVFGIMAGVVLVLTKSYWKNN